MENHNKDVLSLIKTISKMINCDFDRRLEEYGLTCQQGRILFTINRYVNDEGKEIHQNDIENIFKLSKSTVSGLVSRLEKKGLIKKESSPPYYRLFPTEKGLETINYFRAGRDETIRRLLDGFKTEEKEQLLQFLTKLMNNMEGGRNHYDE